MNFRLSPFIDSRFTSLSQRARVASERWVEAILPCPACGSKLIAYPNNTKVYDFHCSQCPERFQLKSSNRGFGKTVLGAEYNTTRRSIERDLHPSLILLEYDQSKQVVEDVIAIQRSCITLSCIIPRKKLSPTAKRHGWQGCLISLEEIPKHGKVAIVRNQHAIPRSVVTLQWSFTKSFLASRPQARGWLADVLRCVELLYSNFSLDNVYNFEHELALKHPKNQNIRPKIRQQLQYLRNMGIIEFVKPGSYRVARPRST